MSSISSSGLDLRDYNVIWDSPSANALGSMPLGNGDVTVNAWIEADGDLIFYIGKSDSWDDNGRLAKVGRVRISLDPNPFIARASFRQELDLGRGQILIQAAPAGQPDHRVELRLCVDANRNAIYVTVDATHPVAVTAAIELWRTARIAVSKLELSDIYHPSTASDGPRAQLPPTITEPDTLLADLPDGIGWYHRNIKSVGPQVTMELQDLLGAPWKDHLLHRTFGALIRSPNAVRSSNGQLRSPPATHHEVSVYVLTRHPATEDQWLAEVRGLVATAEAVDLATRMAQHAAWWEAFWKRSHIYIAGGKDSDGYRVALGYNLQRFITACAGRGAYPIKFNGSTFVMPWPDKPDDADHRRWGPGYWWQNTRLPYFSRCAAGDYEQMGPLFDMYAGEVLDVCRYRTRRYFGIDGAYFPECIYPWGAVFPEAYGWEVPAAQRKDKLQISGWHKWEWVCGLELVFLMQDYFDHTIDADFLNQRLLPTARAVLTFFDQFYRVGDDGKLIMHPSQAAETWWDCTNPMTEIAGLHAVCNRLLALDARQLPTEDRRFLRTLQQKLPELPKRALNVIRMLAAADRFENKRNSENPELYAVFPFRLCALEKDNVTLGIQAMLHREDRGWFGWRQDDIFAAYLGLTDQAREGVVSRATNKDPNCRFPAFWGPNYDWTPDQDHGGVLMIALQSMLMQTEGRKILLLPAWPSQWDADFRLHAPYKTIVEGSVRAGALTRLDVSPVSRRDDVIVMQTR